jgi:SH3 domain-containing kinase-binding protein 1
MSKNPHMQDMSRQQTPVQQQHQLSRSPTSPTTRPVSSSSNLANNATQFFSTNGNNNDIMTRLLDEIQSLKGELDVVRRESARTHQDHKGLQSELGDIKRAHEEQMKKMQKRLQDLVSEIDDEKKTRLALQVELERLKKTIND